jgi:hypothetical protein
MRILGLICILVLVCRSRCSGAEAAKPLHNGHIADATAMQYANSLSDYVHAIHGYLDSTCAFCATRRRTGSEQSPFLLREAPDRP